MSKRTGCNIRIDEVLARKWRDSTDEFKSTKEGKGSVCSWSYIGDDVDDLNYRLSRESGSYGTRGLQTPKLAIFLQPGWQYVELAICYLVDHYDAIGQFKTMDEANQALYIVAESINDGDDFYKWTTFYHPYSQKMLKARERIGQMSVHE